MNQQTNLKRYYCYFFVIALFNLIVYFPSFFHAPRADQIAYLAEVASPNDWFSLAVRTYDLSRTRQFIPGDEGLFRPVLYFFLGSEKYLFGYNFFYWQVTGFILHLAVLWCLLKLLFSLRSSIFAALLTAYFSVLFTVMEMVVWHHINSYMIFLAAILVALLNTYLYVYKLQREPWRLYVIFLCLTMACFIFEMGNIYAILFYFYFRGMISRDCRLPLPAGIFLLPVIFYILFSGINFLLNDVNMTASLPGKDIFNFGATVKNLFIVLSKWTFYGGFADQFRVDWGDRLVAKSIKGFHGLTLLSIALSILYSFVFLKGRKLFKNNETTFPMLMALMVGLYALVFVIARVNPRGLGELKKGLYYGYIYWTFFVILLYSLLDFDRLKQIHNLRLIKSVLIIAFLTLTVFHGIRVYKINQEGMMLSRASLALIKSTETLIKEHKAKEGFSFYVDPYSQGNYQVTWLVKKGDPQGRIYNFIEALYPRYFDNLNPMFRLINGKWIKKSER